MSRIRARLRPQRERRELWEQGDFVRVEELERVMPAIAEAIPVFNPDYRGKAREKR